jgi:WD40 repeat protein
MQVYSKCRELNVVRLHRMSLRRGAAWHNSLWHATSLALEGPAANATAKTTANQCIQSTMLSGATKDQRCTWHLSTPQDTVLKTFQRFRTLNMRTELALWGQYKHMHSCVSTAAAATMLGPAVECIVERLRSQPCGQRIEVSTDGTVWDMALSPDGKQFATAAGLLQVWDAATGALQRRCDVPKMWPKSDPKERYCYSSSWQLYSVLWSPDGRMMAACPTDHTCRVWDVATGALVLALQHKGVCPDAIAWSPDSRMLATGSYDDTARIYDVATGAIMHELKAHERTVGCGQWSPDGSMLATGSWDNSAALWDSNTGELMHRLRQIPGEIFSSAGPMLPQQKGHSAAVKCMAWSPHGCMLATGSDDHTAIIWDVATGDVLHALGGHNKEIASVAWSTDSCVLATGSYDGTVRLHDISADSSMRVLKGHVGTTACPVSAVAFGPHLRRVLASACFDGAVKIWDGTTGQLLQEMSGQLSESTKVGSERKRVYVVAWSQCGQNVYTASVDGTVRITKFWQL